MSVAPEQQPPGGKRPSVSPPPTRQGEALGRRTAPAGTRAVDRLTVAAAELSGRWQIPLMVVALTLLGVSVWRLRPQPKPPSFDQLFAQAAALKEAGLHEEASKAAEALLADPARTPQERVKLHRLLAEVIFAYESGNAVHGPANCRRIIENSDKSLLAGEEFEADAHHMRGLAREWLGQTGEAVVEYRQALAKGVKDPWAARQHVIELRRLDKSITTEQLHEELEAFMSGADVPRELQFWAAEQKIKSYAATGRHDQAEKFLADHSRLFEDSRWKNGYDYLRALVGYHVGRHDEAERLLRSLRERVVPGDPLYAQTGWLLGSILEQQGAPEYALSLFIEVLDKTVPSPSRTACLFGRAECLAETERFAESLKTFEEVIRLSTENPLIAQVDLKDVRESVTAWYQTLYLTGNRERAMAYLKLAARLAPPSDASMQAIYAKRVADLAMELGRAALVRAAEGKTDADSHRQTAHKYLTQSGEEYLRLAKLEGVDIQGTTAAMWQAAETLDLAGERTRMVGVLERFIAAYPEDTRVPEALLQLGRAFQTAGDITRAVEKYQENLIRYPRTPAALASLIPLADCFEELKQKDKAEQTLLRVVTPRPGDALALITPEAPEYQDALFRLGDLYMAEEEYEKAIGRYEEALERYAGDPRADSATFHLADAYRKSAARIRRDLE
ncbi:MAG: tetratricopeptide repeat protein, partial [Planctomycetes bacterium]|nr:tetratricopeptide repeat protein [Planctomycetota bacterium]